jgi:hypothetical protein
LPRKIDKEWDLPYTAFASEVRLDSRLTLRQNGVKPGEVLLLVGVIAGG